MDEHGFCGAGSRASVSHVCKHFYEEPPISGTKGSGAIFFGGCNLKCVFCQNRSISRSADGKELDASALADLFLRVAESGVHNINLVTPTPHAYIIAKALERVKDKLTVPVVYNTGSYECVDTIKMMDGLCDIYLPDIKYASNELSVKYSNASDYPNTAFLALEEMLRQQPKYVTENGILMHGVIARHLCLPSCSKDSLALLDRLSQYMKDFELRLSLMSQYTPDFLAEDREKYKEISRRITGLEYDRVAKKALTLGFDGFFQERSSATKSFTPSFDSDSFKKSERIDINDF